MGFQAYYGVSGLLWGSRLIMGSQVDTLSNNQNTVSGH